MDKSDEVKNDYIEYITDAVGYRASEPPYLLLWLEKRTNSGCSFYWNIWNTYNNKHYHT